MKIKYRIQLTYLTLSCLFFSACNTLTKFVNYPHKDGPRYVFSRKAKQKTAPERKIKVVSYNIKHAKKIKQAVRLLRTKHLDDADVLLVQEMTPQGVHALAAALEYDYVFYPAVHHPILKTGFGNAILSKWPMKDDHKIVLPPLHPNARQRIAVGATLEINGKKVVVYSVHMGVFVNPQKRKKIVHSLIQPLSPSTDYCIVAGDFNTFTLKDREYISHAFSQSDFDHATSNIDWTYKQWYFLNRKAVLDHIYIKGMKKLKAGKIADRSPSDHMPIWAELAFTPNPR